MNRRLLSQILLVAAREFRQITATRSFWVTLAIFPALMAAGPLMQRFTNNDNAVRVMLIDPAGRQAPLVREQIDIIHQRQVLTALARYAQRHDLQQAMPSALWARSGHWYGDAEVQTFMRSGGEKAALAAMAAKIKTGTPAFNAPKAKYEIVPVPAEIAAALPARMDALIKARIDPPPGSKKLNYALYIPSEFGATNANVRLWTAGGTPDGELIQAVQTGLTRDLRQGFLESAGLVPDIARAAANQTPVIAIEAPPPGGGVRERLVVRSALPIASAFVLLMALMLSGSWMLQGVVEEKSNKLIETVLACVSPHALMYGKLVGTVGVGLLMVTVWIVFGIGAALAMQGTIADSVQPALAPLTSPGVIAAMIYFFLAGYLMVSMIFLAIGSVSDSSQEAQSYLMPVVLVIVAPIPIILQLVLREGSAAVVQFMTWLPIWTPFTMLARLGSGVPVWELLGAGAVLAGFIARNFLLGRIFRASLLSSGQKPTFARLIQLVSARENG